MKRILRILDARVTCAATCLACLLAGPSPAMAAAPAVAEDPELAKFLEEFFAREMHELRIPGAVVVWVGDGKVRYAAPFGVANRESGAAVDYDQTVFRLASVSKFFTALCVLQLAQQDKLDLEADVNRYLGAMRVGRPRLGSITASRLLVHTAGLDERLLGYLASDPTQVADLGEYVQAWMPPQTRPAGVVASYSNHGYALLGYLVDRQSGMRFDQYAEEHVFAPLGMEHTAFLVPPLPEAIENGLCRGYRYSGVPVEMLWTRPYPAGALATTGHDMARFIVAFLASVRGEPSETFPPSVVERLTKRYFSHRPDLPGYTLGLAEMNLHGQRLLLKGGAAPGHSAVIAFLPERNAGLFVAVNRQEPQFWMRLLPELIKQQFPDANQPLAAVVKAPPLDRFAGEYRLTRYADASFERIFSLATHVNVIAVGGKLRVHGDVNLECDPTAEPLVFSSDPGRYVAFHEDDRGRIDRMYLNVGGDHMAAERVGFSERRVTVGVATLAALGLLLVAGSIATVAILWRRIRRGAFFDARGALLPFACIGLAAAIVFTFGAAFFAAIPVTRLLYGPSPALWAALSGTNVIAVMAILLLVAAGRRLFLRDARPVGRAAYLALCTASVVLVALLVQFNLLGYRL